MKLISFLIFLLNFLLLVEACLPNESNLCQKNADCCSGYCDKPVNWAYGHCGPRPNWLMSCLNDTVSQCRSHEDCCSGFCYSPDIATIGQCRPNGSCHEDWYNLCLRPSDCCSNNCYKPGNWQYGLCFPPEIYLNRIPLCNTQWRKKRAITQSRICRPPSGACGQGYRPIQSECGKVAMCKKAF